MLTFVAFGRVCTLSVVIKQSIILMLTVKATTHLTVQLYYCQDFLNLRIEKYITVNWANTQLITNI